MGEKVNISGKWYWQRRPRRSGGDVGADLKHFDEEFKKGYIINSPNVVRYICKCKDETGDYILEDFVDGDNLIDFIVKQRFTSAERKKVTEQIASAMEVLERCGIPCSSVSANDIIITSIYHDAVVVSCNGGDETTSGLNKIAFKIIKAARAKCRKNLKKNNAGCNEDDKPANTSIVNLWSKSRSVVLTITAMSVIAACCFIFFVLPVIRPKAVSYINGKKLSGIINGAENISFRVHGQRYDFVLVKAGTFLMGGLFEQHLGNVNGTKMTKIANTPHWVKITKDFYIGTTEVTQKQWISVMGSNPSYDKGKNLPVENVSWLDVCRSKGFLKKLNNLHSGGGYFRLPTESEWEFAARGGIKSRGYIFSGSNNLDSVAWNSGISGEKAHPVAQLKPNELGIYDMSGNVCEWCSDNVWLYSPNTKGNPYIDPQGSPNLSLKILRGGSSFHATYDSKDKVCLVSFRHVDSPIEHKTYFGVRLVFIP